MWPEDEVYEQWKLAGPADRPAIEEKLARCVQNHLKKVIRATFADSNKHEDVLQNAVMAVLQQITKFDGRSAFSTWSHRIAHNKAVDEIKRQSREHEIFLEQGALRRGRVGEADEEEVSWEPRDPVRLSNPIPEIDLQRKLEELSDAERHLADLKTQGYTQKQIGEMLGISEDAAESRIRRLYENLKKS